MIRACCPRGCSCAETALFFGRLSEIFFRGAVDGVCAGAASTSGASSDGAGAVDVGVLRCNSSL